MELTKEKYTISRDTIKKVLDALGDNWFSSDGEEEYNNDDIVEADKALQEEIETQEKI